MAKASHELQKFHVVVAEEGCPARSHSFTEYKELHAFLVSILKLKPEGRRQIFVFSGQRWKVTPGPAHYLITPAGNPTPLFGDMVQLEARDDGITDLGSEDNPEPIDTEYAETTKAVLPIAPTPPPASPFDDSENNESES